MRIKERVNMNVSNKCQPLSEDYKTERKILQYDSSKNHTEKEKKVLILSNSHVRYITTNNFPKGSRVHKFVRHSINEMEDNLQRIYSD